MPFDKETKTEKKIYSKIFLKNEERLDLWSKRSSFFLNI